MVLGEQPLDSSAIRKRIVDLQSCVVRPTLHIVNELQAADVRGPVCWVIIGQSVGRQEVFKLHPVKTLHYATTFRFDEKMLFRVRVSVEIDDLPTHVAEISAECKLGSRELVGGYGLTLHRTLRGLADWGGLVLGKSDQRKQN